MDRRHFIKHTGVLGGSVALTGPAVMAGATALTAPPATTGTSAAGGGILQEATWLSGGDLGAPGEPWFSRSMRWAQLAFVENDPARYDPDFWLDYFRRIHADGALLSAGGVVAFYPTQVPFHHRSDWLGNTNPVGTLLEGCRKMNMSVVLRTDPHATRQDMADAHPDYISVTADGQKRRHWADPRLWVTCAYGPYNFEFMTHVHREIMKLFQPEGIFSNRWAGHGICYCEHCQENFKKATGLALPRSEQRLDPVYQKWEAWRTTRLKELWLLWDGEIRKIRADARFIPNGFPDRLETGKYADFFFADQQARSGTLPPWANAMGAKQLRAGLGMKTLVNIFSVGVEEEYRWKDSVQHDAEIRIWVAEGVAAGMRPCFVKFGAYIYDKRWMKAVESMYEAYYKNEPYLWNKASLARVALVYSEQTSRNYGGKAWQEKSNDHALGMYHALVEDHMPFDMVNDRLLDAEHLKPYKLLILPNIAALSDEQCGQLKDFVKSGGSLMASFETSLYDEEGKPRSNFGLSDLFGVSFEGDVEGPMHNSYLRLKPDTQSGRFHPVLAGLEDAWKIVNAVWQVKVRSNDPALDPLSNPVFANPVTLIPSYPDLPMEEVFPRVEDSNIRELYLRQVGNGRVVYIPGDLDRSFWQMMNADHSLLLRNTIRWALEEEPIVLLETDGVIDVAVWRQERSLTIHLVNLTNPMMMKGPCRQIYPTRASLLVKLPEVQQVKAVHLLMNGGKPEFDRTDDVLTIDIPVIDDHEIVALDLS